MPGCCQPIFSGFRTGKPGSKKRSPRGSLGGKAAMACQPRHMLGRSGLETGDDEADIEPPRYGLDPGAGATFLVPGLSLITGLRETTQTGFMIECAAGADVVGSRLDGVGEYCICRADQKRNRGRFLRTTPSLAGGRNARHRDRDVGRRPMPADAAGEPAQMAAHLPACPHLCYRLRL